MRYSRFREGCGTTKACLFKPAGCDPNLDCTIGLIFFVTGPNKLRVEMVATSLIPAVQQQYIAIAFSNDSIMVSRLVDIAISPHQNRITVRCQRIFEH